jgi:hypothetical protein
LPRILGPSCRPGPRIPGPSIGGIPIPGPKAPGPEPRPETGKYQLNPNVIFNITRKGNMLFFQQNDRDKLEILPESETEFFLREADIKVTFVRDSKKRVTQLILHLGDRDLPAQKISR